MRNKILQLTFIILILGITLLITGCQPKTFDTFISCQDKCVKKGFGVGECLQPSVAKENYVDLGPCTMPGFENCNCYCFEKVELANPASVYCKEQGGTLEIRDTDEGQVGYCLFEDGSECEEWAFYHEKCQSGSLE
ncbi:MAG: DUF333 domain-containing protein [Patescibacteria group bacterium]|jgi:putative hemolysin|nr:DUF333 domain-containing protein [Patescibacteria group bacterium]